MQELVLARTLSKAVFKAPDRFGYNVLLRGESTEKMRPLRREPPISSIQQALEVGMRVGLVVHLEINPEHVNEFIDIVTRHGAYSLANEPGCESFMVMRSDEGEGRLVLVEVYASEEALESHWASGHMQAYREKTEGMIAGRERYRTTVLPAIDA